LISTLRLITPGLSGDTETLTNVSAVSGTAVLNNGTVSSPHLPAASTR
jgi:hypothetical protein